MKKDIFSAVFISIYIIVYCILLPFNDALNYAMLMLVLSPLLFIWLIVVILKDGKYNGKELGDEEFGYQDKNKNEIGIF